MLRKLLAVLLSHPRFGPLFIQRLSETWPIRRAAKFTAYLYLRGKLAVEEGVKKELFKGQQQQIDLSRFKERFQAELQKGIEEAKEDLRRRQQK